MVVASTHIISLALAKAIPPLCTHPSIKMGQATMGDVWRHANNGDMPTTHPPILSPNAPPTIESKPFSSAASSSTANSTACDWCWGSNTVHSCQRSGVSRFERNRTDSGMANYIKKHG